MNNERTKDRLKTIAALVLCVVIGLVMGLVVLLIINPGKAFAAWVTMLQNFLFFPRADVALGYFGNTLVKTAPLVMCALSVIYAKKAGLFNIGASGQFTAGAGACLSLAIGLKAPWWVCLIGGILAGALVGAITGVVKAYREVNEVIAGIMLNWIVLYVVNSVLVPYAGSNLYTTDLSRDLPSVLMPSLLSGRDAYATIAIPLTVLLAIFIQFVLTRTSLGFKTSAIGYNRNAAKLAGMREKENQVLTMAIAGGLCGCGAGFLYLSGMEQWFTGATTVHEMGFNAIAAAFLGGLNPIGTLFASYFIQHIKQGSAFIDKVVFPNEISNLVVAIIVLTCAFAAFIKGRFKK